MHNSSPRPPRPPRTYPRDLVPDEAELGQTIERFLRRRLGADPPHVSKLLRQGRVFYIATDESNAVALEYGATLSAPGVIRVTAGDGRAPPQPNRRLRLKLLHEDDDLVVIDKPAGVATHPGPRHGSDTILNALLARFPEMAALGRERSFGLAHRLDLDTSGVLLAARTVDAYENLAAAFADRRIDKRYIALVDASVASPAPGTLRTAVDGKSSRTEVERVERFGPVAMLWMRLHTGRTHQIRIQLRDAGAPVLRDDRYGAGKTIITARLYLARLALHAEWVHLLHPRTGQPMEFQRELPRDLRDAWRRARKAYGPDAGADTVDDDDANDPSDPQDDG